MKVAQNSTSNVESPRVTNALQRLDSLLADYAAHPIPGLQRLMTARGKRFRSKLLFTILQGTQQSIDASALSAAVAIELVHTASLIHDDMLDKGTIRWNVATINAIEGSAMALIAGDYLLAQACAVASEVNEDFGQIIAQTISAMCIGQAQELESQFDTSRRAESVISCAEGKTAALFVAVCEMAGQLAGLDTDSRKHLSEFGRQLGIAYQLYDDLSDFEPVTSSSTKIASRDFEIGNYTLPIILAMHSPIAGQLRALLKNTTTPGVLVGVLEAAGTITEAERIAADYMLSAQKSLAKVHNPKLSAALRQLLHSHAPNATPFTTRSQ